MKQYPSQQRAFTLIELLVVVAIIGILVSIATVNMVQARMRARVGRVQADMRSIATALGSYRLDNGGYPETDWKFAGNPYQEGWETVVARIRNEGYGVVWKLTSPVAYMNMWPEDIFRSGKMTMHDGKYYDYYYWVEPRQGNQPVIRPNIHWMVFSRGPQEQFIGGIEFNWYAHYDPTNGLKSQGMIVRFGP